MEKTTKTVWPSLAESARIWGKLGLLSFGGPTAQIALMHRLIVVERRWLNESQFLNALSFCMLLPGPEAMQLAIYTGWRIHGVLGGLIAGLLFVLPGALIMFGLGLVYVTFGTVGFIGAAFLGLKAAIVVIVLQALIRLAQKSLKKIEQWIIAAIGFVGIFIFALPFPLIIGLSAIYGFASISANTKAALSPTAPALPKAKDTIKTVFIWICLWWGPLLALDLIAGTPLLAQIGYFFSKLAVVTFGGAYAVLAYMAQDVVGQLNWLTPAEMMDGLGLAETTPGPLILVTEFVGFLAGFKTAGLIYGIFGAVIALWATFIPCFLWIFAGATYLDWLTQQPRLSGALASIMAAVVGVIANLFAWFALHLFFDKTTTLDLNIAQILVPNFASLDLRVTAIAIVCGWLALWRHVGLLWLLGIAGLAGILSSMITIA
ncbi:chromate efflux transporter [Candidatus Puniceispirillum sp.]|nr:chromate efflux transporter [Candidatus Puniceispirillum sp.]